MLYICSGNFRDDSKDEYVLNAIFHYGTYLLKILPRCTQLRKLTITKLLIFPKTTVMFMNGSPQIYESSGHFQMIEERWVIEILLENYL